MNNRPIGVFDSGIGGLTVVDALAKSLPNESILYVGDTARVPYGNKSKVRIQEFTNEITQWLVDQNSKMIVVACNTASSLALDYIKSKFDLDTNGYGTAVYSFEKGERNYSLICFSQFIKPEERSDRVIATKW